MNPAPDRWQKLAAHAARAPRPPAADSTAPPWFAARVTARWLAGDLPFAPSPWEIFSVRSVALAALVMLLALTANYDLLHDQFTHADQPVDLLLAALDEP